MNITNSNKIRSIKEDIRVSTKAAQFGGTGNQRLETRLNSEMAK